MTTTMPLKCFLDSLQPLQIAKAMTKTGKALTATPEFSATNEEPKQEERMLKVDSSTFIKKIWKYEI